VKAHSRGVSEPGLDPALRPDPEDPVRDTGV
jgi:hypothetical protein